MPDPFEADIQIATAKMAEWCEKLAARPYVPGARETNVKPDWHSKWIDGHEVLLVFMGEEQPATCTDCYLPDPTLISLPGGVLRCRTCTQLRHERSLDDIGRLDAGTPIPAWMVSKLRIKNVQLAASRSRWRAAAVAAWMIIVTAAVCPVWLGVWVVGAELLLLAMLAGAVAVLNAREHVQRQASTRRDPGRTRSAPRSAPGRHRHYSQT